MKMSVWFLQLFILVGLSVGFAIPKPDNEKRIKDKPLSDETHYKNEEHNLDYDHEAFLGEEEAKEFDNLKPEESRSRLAKIVDKIDKDKDGFVTSKELQEWIQYSQKRYILDDVDRQWKSHNAAEEDKITWEDYKKVSYGFMEDLDEKEADGDENVETYKDMIRRDQRRWNAADKDGDGSLTKEEFTDFLHPEETAHMQDIVITETMEDIDKDKDDRLSLEEYIGDMYSAGGDPDEEPDWVKNERAQFKNYRDKNKDGYMDREEVRDWILPPDYDHSEAETKHLMFESDANKDQKLSKQEILDKYDLFVGSQVTDFGEALVGQHDEF